MKRIGITGRNGFIGTHLYNTLKLHEEKYEIVEFDRDWFQFTEKLQQFVSQCDTIVHLAALNRHNDPEIIYETNVSLVKKLIDACEESSEKPHIIMASSTQEERDNEYGRSKKKGRELFKAWAKKNGALFTGMVIPNVYGPFGDPYYNSVVATFSYQLTHNETPEIHKDGDLKLIYVAELVQEMLRCVNQEVHNPCLEVGHTAESKVSDLLSKLNNFKKIYFEKGEIPELADSFELNLFNTFRSYIDPESHFPVKLEKHSDDRGAFVEIIRLGVGGQASFSTTVPGITRGNHYHTRKVERFAVIKGKARIELRKIGTDQVHEFKLDGNEPAYVDMPIWYTHNITNIGNDELYTIFWINEPYDPEDADTYYEEV